MVYELNKGDAQLLAVFAEYGLLAVAQLTAITQRSNQVITRYISPESHLHIPSCSLKTNRT